MINNYKKFGFQFIPSFFSDDEVSQLDIFCQELSQKHFKEGYYENSVIDVEESVLVRMEKILTINNRFRTILIQSKVSSLLELCLGEKAVLFKDKINFKPPGNRADLLHQDQQAGWGDYAPYFVTLCICVDENTSLNGCLMLPDKEIYKHNLVVYGNSDEPLKESAIPSLSLKEHPAQPGDIFIFDSYVPHASNPNYSREDRRNIYLTFNGLSHGDHYHLYYSKKYLDYPPNAYRDQDRTYEYKV